MTGDSQSRSLGFGSAMFLVSAMALAIPALLPAQRGWVERVLDGPGSLMWSAVAYDSAREVVVSFGGRGSLYSLASSDTWEWDGTAWTQRFPETVPPGRSNHAMAYDAVRQRVVMFGGRDAVDHGEIADTWEWDGTDWELRATGATGIAGHAMVFDERRGVVLLLGSRAFLAWNGISWSSPAGIVLPPVPDYNRLGHAMAYDSAHGRVILNGGHNGNFLFRDTWAWDGASWTQLMPQEYGIAGDEHSMVFDSLTGRILMFRGQADLHEWSDEISAWIDRREAVKPPPRLREAMVFDSGRGVSVLVGGYSAFDDVALGDTWEYSSGSPSSFQTFGVGCAGSVGTPTLDAASGQLPWIGELFDLEIGSIPTSVANVPFGLLGLSASEWEGFELPRELSDLGMPGCTQYTSVEFVFTLVNSGGSTTWQIPIPNNPALIGLRFYTQAVVFDFGVNYLGAVVSNAGVGVIGAR